MRSRRLWSFKVISHQIGPLAAFSPRELRKPGFEGERSPADLLKFAEGVGMIEELDLTVCPRALALMDSWSEGPQLTLAVNMSGRFLRRDAFVGALRVC